MRQIIKGIALLVLLAIIIFILWCFVLGKCSGKTFSMIPPRPRLNVSGRGSSNAGAQGSGKGSVSPSGSGGSKEGCSFWDFGCKLQRFFAEGTTFFGQKPMIPEPLRNYVKPSVLRGGR